MNVYAPKIKLAFKKKFGYLLTSLKCVILTFFGKSYVRTKLFAKV